MGLVRKIKAGLVKVSVNDFVGEDGNIFFDIDDGVLRLSDGATPGGIPLASAGAEGSASTFRQLLDTPSSFTGAAGNFVKVNAQGSAIEFVDVDLFDGDYNSLSNLPTLFNPSDITTSLIPRTDVAIDLGSTTKKWRDLYLSGSTIYLGNAVIRNVDGTVELPANAKVNGKKIPIDVSELEDINGILNGQGGSVTSYNDLTDLPTLFSGNYNDLTNKPTIPTVPTTISSFTNDAGYLTSIGTISYNDLIDKPTIPADISDLTDNSNLLAGTGGDGSYTLPVATNNTLGGIKIGSGLSINDSGVVSVTVSGVTSYNDLTDTPDLSVYQLAATAFDGAYSSLTGLPTLFSGAYADLTGTPTIPADVSDLTDTTNLLDHFSGSYNDLTDKPTLFSGAYADLTGAPDLSVYQLAVNAFSGDYNDLINTPAIPTVPTLLSAFTNDSGYITGYTVTQADVTQHQAALSITESQISDFGTYEPADATILKSAAIGVTVQAYDANIVSDANYAHITVTSTSVTDGTTTFNQYDDAALAGRVTTLESAGYLTSVAFADLTTTPTTIAGYGITDAFDGAYSSLTGAPTALSAFANDSGYITGYTVTQSDVTQHQAALSITESQISDLKAYLTSVAFADLTTTPTTLTGYGITDAYTSTQVDAAITTAVNNVLDGAPELLDTLNEIAAAVGDDPNFVSTINTAIDQKANTADLATVATTGSYTDLLNSPVIPTDVSDLTDNNNVISGSNITEDDLITYSILFG